ncbi:HugZ family pyridoxamine 5'-phosphate oxidase [Vibrio diazotrophicus]|uniref:HugZ family pyridoxamine 5'-phosphate oxidase n=1 Tax=Vibrio diazotrophicus TaxID=685 RepID=UPI000C9EC1E9|nr:pyridoxamine 5'-phosphate oxidase family protein [Vibrio diazotrophicus]PNH90497.1 heme utilization protein [Vibrio diazotrophicus]
MSYREEQLERLPARIQAFIEQFSTAQLSTVDDKGIPLASYGPFVRQGNDFIMLLSTVSKHARNLQCHPKASLMLVEPEDKARHLFARERLVIDCDVVHIDKDHQEAAPLKLQMKATFGDIVEQLCGMKDFSFYRFVPKSGNYVKGFGQAFRLDRHMQQAIHLTEGHTEEMPA